MNTMTMNQKALTSGKLPQKISIEALPAWDVNAAMRDLYDVCERAMLPYVLLGETAKQLFEGVEGFNGNDLKVDKIEWGMFERNLTPEIQSLFKVWGFESWEDKGFTYTFQNVPVFVTVITKKYKVFDMPDMKFYGPDFFKLPNPFETYYKMRHLIK